MVTYRLNVRGLGFRGWRVEDQRKSRGSVEEGREESK